MIQKAAHVAADERKNTGRQPKRANRSTKTPSVATSNSNSQESSPAKSIDPTGTVTVVGEGHAAGSPDVFVLEIAVSVMRPTVAKGVEEAGRVAQMVLAALRGQGIPADSIRTSGFQITPEQDRNATRRTFLGYRARNAITARTGDVAAAGRILDSIADLGSEVAVLGIRFELRDQAKLQKRARKQAWADAKAKATQLAALAGIELGSATRISESIAHRPRAEGVPSAMAVLEDITPIEPGQLTVDVALEVTFATGERAARVPN